MLKAINEALLSYHEKKHIKEFQFTIFFSANSLALLLSPCWSLIEFSWILQILNIEFD